MFGVGGKRTELIFSHFMFAKIRQEYFIQQDFSFLSAPNSTRGQQVEDNFEIKTTVKQ